MGLDESGYYTQSQQKALQWHYTVLDDKNFEIRGKTLFSIVVVFSALLVFTLLFLYARWACRYRRASLPQSSTSQPPISSQGLDAASIKGIPVISHRSSTAAEKTEECSICLAVFEEGERVKVLPRCSHGYHPECLDHWLSSQPSCPLCRDSLRVDSALPNKIAVVVQ